ncbi:MAG: N-6 DNA methylase [Candidatus Paceibacterota bacterium]|jgi:adenine-specific DNA-methyltransferase
MRTRKENGSYYTPEIIADFIIKRVFDNKHYFLPRDISVLESSVGDGIFVRSLLSSPKVKTKKLTLEVVEREGKELKKALVIADGLKSKQTKIISHHRDYLEFEKTNKNKYDLIIGNPPYIKKNHLSKKQLSLCENIHKRAKLSDKKIKNIWTAFLIGAVESLNENGVISLVLPAELLQVSYTKELRNYLRNTLNKIEIFAFNELVFEGIEQDVIIIIGTKSSKNKGVSFFQANKLVDLKKPDLIPGNTNIDRETLDKWTNYILSEKELSFLDSLKKKLKEVRDYSKVQVGIVTAVNNFFIINEDIVKNFKLNSNCTPILQKSSFVPVALTIRKNDFFSLKKRGKPVFLLSLPDKPEDFLSKNVKKYIKSGVDEGIHKGYKCSIRNHWYHVPSVWPPEGVFIKRSNIFPRIMTNEAKVNVTDAFYRISMKDGYNIKSLAFSFCNSLSLIFAELEGRFYGGGVLELIPNEFKSIPIPYSDVKEKDFEYLDRMLRKKEPIDTILDYTDRVILKKTLKLANKDIKNIRKIYSKLVNRRMKVSLNKN